MGTTYVQIHFEIEGGVARLTLDNQAKRNAFGIEMRGEIAEAVARVKGDRTIRALILTGAGPHFCSGGDLDDILKADLDNAGWRERLLRLHGWLRDLVTLEKPVIAAVDGAAYGAGFSLALTADFIIATQDARFSMSFIRMGLVPDCAAFYTLPRMVGHYRAKELMLSGRELSAQEALAMGIVCEIVAPKQLQARARAMAQRFVTASPIALSLIKRSLGVAAADLPSLLEVEANAQAMAMGTPERREAIQRFLEKKSPLFSWPMREGR